MAETAPEKPSACTHFVFEHKVFSAGGGYFSLDSGRKEARFHMPLGNTEAAISLRSLRNEFELNGDCRDSNLIDTVEKSLRFVKIIRVGDAVPQELLDGTASWSVDENHRAAANNRVKVQMITWLAGAEEQVTDESSLQKLMDSKETKQRLLSAIDSAVETLGLEKDQRQELINNIDKLAHELSFIEALRSHFNRIKGIARKVMALKKIYHDDLGVKEDLDRVWALLRPFLEDIDTKFDLTDAQTCEIIQVLRKFDLQVNLIRESRDDLHEEFLKWEDPIKRWDEEPADKRSENAIQLARETYRFLAQHYPQTQDWTSDGEQRASAH